ncbi:hypothetical protein AMTRI_Chr01g111930 [Amborella trichopoda]
MEGSADLNWEKSVSRGLNDCTFSSVGISRDASNNTDWVQANQKRLVLSSTDNFNNLVGSSRVCGDGPEANNSPNMGGLESGDISLRHWLDKPERSVNILECLHIFRQIVETVNIAHSNGIVVQNVRPSCFLMSSFNRVSFIESASCSSSGSDSIEHCTKITADELKSDSKPSYRDQSSSSPFPNSLLHNRSTSGSAESPQLHNSVREDFQRVSGISVINGNIGSDACRSQAGTASCLQSPSALATRVSSIKDAEKLKVKDTNMEEEVEEQKNPFPLKQILLMEINWYNSPEEVSGATGSFSSDVYRLGVLLFELFCPFNSEEEKLRTMSNLRHRVLPPQLLLKWPKEASFCLWLLHPQPNTRPKMSEVLQSEFLNEPRDNLEDRQAAIKLKDEIEEQELLLEFLLQMQQRKQGTADKLHDVICCLSSDIEEVQRQQSSLKLKRSSSLQLNPDLEQLKEPVQYPVKYNDSTSLGSRKRFKPGMIMQQEEEIPSCSVECKNIEENSENHESITSKCSRLMRNFKKLEAAYFSTRCGPTKPAGQTRNKSLPGSGSGRGIDARTEGSTYSSVDNLASKENQGEGRRIGWINPFLDGLCKHLAFSKLRVRADLKQGDLLNSSNLVCSLGFDRDKEFFATAGVNRKIKVFECDMILNEDLDIHYPVIEMASRSKLSSICWNSYIKSQMASSDFEGIVQVWDVARSQVFMDLREHERRVWSVDFSQADPTRLASGSDDGAVKLWNINQGGSVGTIKTKANVCCVQFAPDSSRSLAIGSADHKVYCYDLRNTKMPWCTLIGHTKTVSYIKFIDSTTLVSASTDSTLKLWDLSMNTSRVIESPVQTFTGHTNIKNFVGLSISDGYITTGSETNEVFVYHKAFPMPVLSYKFRSSDPLTGQEVDDASQFISCVCWRGHSSTLVAANSTGNIKIFEMV